jgi:hypothetical protein
MSDYQGKGPVTNEGRVEKHTSRPAENKPSDVKKNTSQRVADVLKKK